MAITLDGTNGITTPDVDSDGLNVDGAATISGNLTVDTNTLFVDAANNRVGVGTSSPDALLHASNLSARVRVGITATNQFLDIFRENATGASVYNAAQGAPFGFHVFQTDGSERARIDAPGNLLVGTTTPAGSVSNSAQLVSGKFVSIQGFQVGANNTATTVVTLPNVAFATYMVSGGLEAGDTANYHNVSIVSTQFTSAKITNLVTSTLFFITLSGLSVQMRQSSGIAQNMTYVVTRIA
jgi:hypothetical protein